MKWSPILAALPVLTLAGCLSAGLPPQGLMRDPDASSSRSADAALPPVVFFNLSVGLFLSHNEDLPAIVRPAGGVGFVIPLDRNRSADRLELVLTWAAQQPLEERLRVEEDWSMGSHSVDGPSPLNATFDLKGKQRRDDYPLGVTTGGNPVGISPSLSVAINARVHYQLDAGA